MAEPRRAWENRIVGHGEVDPASLLPNPLNPRVHTPAQRSALDGAIADVGYIRSVTVNRRSGRLVDGHLRVAMAIASGQATIPVEYVDLADYEEAEALATLDPIAAMARNEAAKTDLLLREINTGQEGVMALLDQLSKEAGLYRQEYTLPSEALAARDEPALAPTPGADPAPEARAEKPRPEVHALAIVLGGEDWERWQGAKRALGARTDKEALLRLLDGWEEGQDATEDDAD